VQKIRQMLKKSNHLVSVGSVEEFQGQERRVIIITTVRSNTAYVPLDYLCKLGFLSNPKVWKQFVSNLVGWVQVTASVLNEYVWNSAHQKMEMPRPACQDWSRKYSDRTRNLT
jgi:AAA domain